MITFRNVYKELASKKILSDVSFSIEPKKTLSIVGLSGAGKSVTLKHMVRLLAPDSGNIEIDGVLINNLKRSEMRKIRLKFGFLFQSSALLQNLSVFENIALPLRQRTNFIEDKINELVNQRLDWIDLVDSSKLMPSELSGGMKKRVGLARATIMNPEIILYDEPTSGLDPVTSRKIDKLIKKLNNETGVTSVVVTHDLISALSIGDKILMLHNGSVVELSSPENFIKSEVPIVKDFLKAQNII
ncbi:MAG: ABC transporter ATP-binding protein [Pontiellaceae bacterium]